MKRLEMLLAIYRQKDRIDVFRNCQEIIPVVQSLTFSVFYRLRLSFPSALGSYRRSKHFHKEHFPSWSRRSNSCRNVGYLVNSDGLFLLGPPPEGTSDSNPVNRNHQVLSLTLSTSLKMIFYILSKLQDPSLDILIPLLVPISLETVRMTGVYSLSSAALQSMAEVVHMRTMRFRRAYSLSAWANKDVSSTDPAGSSRGLVQRE